MKGISVFGGAIRVLVLVLAQVLLFKGLVLYDQAFCFAYILIFLLIPTDTNPLLQLILGFVIGISVDAFYHTLGVHAAASVLLCYARYYWSQFMTPNGGYDAGPKINVRTQGLEWFLTYSYPLILLHSLLLFFIEAGGFGLFWLTLGKAFYSSLFTTLIVIIIQYLFYKKMK